MSEWPKVRYDKGFPKRKVQDKLIEFFKDNGDIELFLFSKNIIDTLPASAIHAFYKNDECKFFLRDNNLLVMAWQFKETNFDTDVYNPQYNIIAFHITFGPKKDYIDLFGSSLNHRISLEGSKVMLSKLGGYFDLKWPHEALYLWERAAKAVDNYKMH